ncbi:MAG TPA: penicillin-insensitive murein endopeptidase [Kofleriaceae bacterium]|jgi:penicillin-insensitive murein endopeptidase|nr:penicillin-insensitive murein endopeptidase [Kofleriaceae bacterium]
MTFRGGRLAWIAIAISAASCAELGVPDEDRARSFGACNGGMVIHPLALPAAGDGYWIPPLWIARNHVYGTDGLIDLVVGTARRIAKPGAPRLAVGDLSPATGGASLEHHSHQAGRDVDLLYFMTTKDGAARDNEQMRHLRDDGTTMPGDGEPAKFDVARNWQLVRALVTAPEAEVQYIFLYEPLSQQLLAYAHDHGEADTLIARARAVLHQPSDSAKHDDHMHVRIYCSAEDRAAGCVDRGPPPPDDEADVRGPDESIVIVRDALRRVPPTAFAGR